MEDQLYVLATGSVIVGLVVVAAALKRLDPFAPIWLFLAGYLQLYVVQATSYRDYSIRVRGIELVASANRRAFWALLWFLAVYFFGVGRWFARKLPSAPAAWSRGLVLALAPPLIVWGLICSGISLDGGNEPRSITAEENLLRQFPALMLVGGVALIVSGGRFARPNRAFQFAGLATTFGYSAIWMFNGKRSHALFGVLTGVCAYYSSRGKKPPMIVLGVTGLACAAAVSLALGWRNNPRYERSLGGFSQYVSEFNVEKILVNLNMRERSDADPNDKDEVSKETEEYCAYLLMLDTVPDKSDYDYGESYLRLVSTFIPRILWADKPIFGREKWISAWIAGSEFHRDHTFTGPAIGILGATQLNGGALGTLLVLGVLATLWRALYEYFRAYRDRPWAQAWWALTYYNAWLMVANDDPFVWFYYIYGFGILPAIAVFWLFNKAAGEPRMTAPTTFDSLELDPETTADDFEGATA